MRAAVRDHWRELTRFLRTPTLSRSVIALLTAAILLLLAINAATFVGPTDLFLGYRPEAAGTHALYQDITIPASNSTGVATLVGISAPTADSTRPVVTIGAINNVPTPQEKAVLFVRKAGGGPEDTY